jgi:hypothetical protein
MNNSQQWLKTKDACLYAGIEKRSLYDWRQLGLKYSKLPSGSILYNRNDIDGFLNQYQVTESQIDALCDEILQTL